MTTAEAMELFGGRRELAAALRISVQATYQWGDDVPELRQYQIKELADNTRT